MARVDHSKELRELMECPICTEIMIGGERDPKMLDCGHIVCSTCVNGLVERSNNRKIECPVCRDEIYVGPNHVFHTLYQFAAIAQSFMSNRKAFENKICTECYSFVDVSARHFCGGCYDKLCFANEFLKARYVFRKRSAYERVLNWKGAGYPVGEIVPQHVLLGPGDSVPDDAVMGTPTKAVALFDSFDSTLSPIHLSKTHKPPVISSPNASVVDGVLAVLGDSGPVESAVDTPGPSTAGDESSFVRLRQTTAQGRVLGVFDVSD